MAPVKKSLSSPATTEVIASSSSATPSATRPCAIRIRPWVWIAIPRRSRSPKRWPISVARATSGSAVTGSPLNRRTVASRSAAKPSSTQSGRLVRVPLGAREPPGADRRLVPEEVLHAQPRRHPRRRDDRCPPPHSRCTPSGVPRSTPRSVRSTTPRRRTARDPRDVRAARARGTGRTPRTTIPVPPRLARDRCPRCSRSGQPPPCRTRCAGSREQPSPNHRTRGRRTAGS